MRPIFGAPFETCKIKTSYRAPPPFYDLKTYGVNPIEKSCKLNFPWIEFVVIFFQARSPYKGTDTFN